MADALLSFVKAAAAPPACLLCGEETQLIEEARASVRRRFDADNRHSVELSQLQPPDMTLGQSKGLFGGGAELFQLTCAGKPPPAGLAFIEEMAARVQPPDCLLVVLSDWDYKYKKAAWFKKLETLMPVQVCARLSPPAAAAWIHHWAAEQQLQLAEDATRFLCEQTEGNLFAAKQAIAKLALTGDAATDTATVRQVLADGARYDIFDLSDAIYSGNPARALAVFNALRADGVADTLIQWSVISVLNNIAAQKSGGRVLAWGRQRDAVRTLARRVNDNMLRRLVMQAAYADRVTKGVATGDVEPILGGVIARLAAWQRGVKIALPHFQPWQ